MPAVQTRQNKALDPTALIVCPQASLFPSVVLGGQRRDYVPYGEQMRYDLITEKPYCCVPAILQMIQARRGLRSTSQDEIGWELGLIVPPEIKSEFTKVRTGPKPQAGYGTQISNPQFSIENYFVRNHLPLAITKISASSIVELHSIIGAALDQDDDIVLCLNSLHLFGDGDLEHVVLIEECDRVSGQLTVVDPAIGAPMRRITTVDSIFETIQEHSISALGGLWIISEQGPAT